MPADAAEFVMTECLRLGNATTERASDCPSRLIQQAKEGSAEAFEQIMLRYEQKVFATSWRMLGNEADARDAVQEVFLRVLKYIGSFKLDQDFGGWLYRIVINTCRDARRRGLKARMFASLEAELESGACDALRSEANHEADAIVSQQRALIRAALDTLTKKERAAIVLRDLEGLSTEEVAQILGSSATTVRSQICSARSKIRIYRDRLINAKRPEMKS